jgi:uncharacterized protein
MILLGFLMASSGNTGKRVIGMVHLQALAGSPRYGGDLSSVRAAALRDAETLAEGGVDAVMIENFGDVPFHPARVPAETVAQVTAIAAAIRERVSLPIGINMLRNDGCSAMAVAHAVGGCFVRVNVLCGARVTDQGIIQGIAHDLLRLRKQLAAEAVQVLADVDVKHSAPLASRPIEEEVADTIERGLADGLIVSGSGTGRPTELDHVRLAKAAAGATPVLVGSGVTAETVNAFPHADGFIVGSALKRDGVATNPVDAGRIRQFMQAIRRG